MDDHTNGLLPDDKLTLFCEVSSILHVPRGKTCIVEIG